VRLILYVLALFCLHVRADVMKILQDPELFEKPIENRIGVIFYSAPNAIDWSSPGAMVRTAIWNTLTGDTNPLSHVDALVSCEGERSELSGMSRVSRWSDYTDILSGRKSLDMLTESYPGNLITEQEIRAELPHYSKLGRVRTLSFKVSKEVCSRTLKYVREYRERDYGKTYAGFTANPFKGEGAGCAAYAMSVLQVAGLLDQTLIAKWTRRLHVPKDLIASKTKSALKNFWDFTLFRWNGHWGTEGGDSLSIVVFDPELMFNWVAKISDQPETWDKTARALKSDTILGLEADRSLLETPAGDFWANVFPPNVSP
jgi:hypothetical protein